LEVNPGFNPSQVLTARIWLPVPNNPDLDPYRPPEKRVAFIKEVLQRTSALPGVQHAAVGSGNGVPLLGPHNKSGFVIEDQPTLDTSLPSAQVSTVSPDYFSVLGTPLLRGRLFLPSDDLQAPRVVLIDDALARRWFPNQDPVGKHLKPGRRDSKAPWLTVAGVVGNIKTDGFEQPDQPHLYMPILQNPGYGMAIYLRTQVDPSSLTNLLRQQVQAIDPNLPVFGERTMDDVVSASLAQRRFAMQVVSLFGVLALLLAGIGIYGVMAYSVSQRTREIGIRMALGAGSGAILRPLLWQGMLLTIIGVSIGLASAFALTRSLRSLLYEVAPNDLLTYVGIAVLLMGVAMLACYVPARRATRINPLLALRNE
jgi:putative ABC transport system permease protein